MYRMKPDEMYRMKPDEMYRMTDQKWSVSAVLSDPSQTQFRVLKCDPRKQNIKKRQLDFHLTLPRN